MLAEPIITLVCLKPRNGTYLINLNCQKTALRILKEITRSLTFDDSNQLLKIIDRLKIELDMLYADFNQERTVSIHPSDDSDYYGHSLAKRQDFISSCLRYLCFAIVRTDPNTINNNTGFVAHSRKILESGLFEDKIRD